MTYIVYRKIEMTNCLSCPNYIEKKLSDGTIIHRCQLYKCEKEGK